MMNAALVQRSPVRAFMKSINGGLAPGEIGVIASRSGIGKTSVLVQIAMDKLLHGKKIIHVSFTQHTDYVLLWYKNILDEFLKKKNIKVEQDVENQLTKNRVLMKFNQEGISVDQILRSLRAMIKDGGFAAEHVIVDGYNFTSRERDNISRFKDFGKELELSLWFSCNVNGEPFYNQKNIPAIIGDYADLFDVIVALEPKQETMKPVSREPKTRTNQEPGKQAQSDYIEFVICRNRGAAKPKQPALRLDPRTLLILEADSK